MLRLLLALTMGLATAQAAVVPPSPPATFDGVDIFTSAVAAGAKTGNPWVKPGTPVTYRIPALVTTKTTVIAFASERLASSSD